MFTATSPEPAITPAPPLWSRGLRRRDGLACGFDSTSAPIFCGLSSSCVANNGAPSCQKITSFSSFPNSTTASFGTTSTSSSGFISVTLHNSQSADDTVGIPGHVSTPTITNQYSTYDPSSFISTSTRKAELSTTQSSSDGYALGCGLFGSRCYTPPATSTSHTASSATPTASPSAIVTPANTLPIVLPSAFVVIFAVIFSIVGNRRKWISRAYHHLSRERQLHRRILSDASPRAAAAAADDDLAEDATPLRDLETPPPAYSPYRFSWADHELLNGASFQRASRPTSELDMIGLAYPLGDRGRHRSG